MRLILLASANDELDWFREYYGEVFQAGAERALSHYVRAIANLSDHPYIGKPLGFEGLRRYNVPRTPLRSSIA